MPPLDRFAAYAAAFERFVASRDGAVLEPFFTEGAVYETIGGPPFEGVVEGRDAVIAALAGSLDGFDRRFATRELATLDGPRADGDRVWFRWRATYSKPGLPDLAIEGEETATFEGERIARLEDRFTDASVKEATAYLGTHAAALFGD